MYDALWTCALILSFLFYIASVCVSSSWGYHVKQFRYLRSCDQLDIDIDVSDENLYNRKLDILYAKLVKKAHKRFCIGLGLYVLSVIAFCIYWGDCSDIFSILYISIISMPAFIAFVLSYFSEKNGLIGIVLAMVGFFLLLTGINSAITFENIGIDEKPVIYLYGYEGDASVSLNPSDGIEITVDYPEFDEDHKWNVSCSKDGYLVDSKGKNHRYLFYETNDSKDVAFQDGFCVKGSEVIDFFEVILPKLGLNDYEMEDFITYWFPRMMNNEYNVIRFVPQEEYDELIGLDVSPKADSVIRIYMRWYGSDKYVDIEKQDIIDRSADRIGRYVVEWGGMEVER